MVKNILILLIIIAFAGCSMSKKIERKFDGEGRDLLISEFGEPQSIVELKDGSQLFIYVKETYIRETEIGTGQFTLDKRISPGFVKQETFKFIIDSNGVINSSSYEKSQK